MTDPKKLEAASEARLCAADPPDWIARMHDDYVRTGTVRVQDAKRLSGDSTSSPPLSVAPNEFLLRR